MKYPLVAMFATFTIFSIANSFSNLFLSIYIWKQHQDLLIVGWYQVCSFLFTFIGIICGAYLIRLFGSRVNFLTSSIVAFGLYMYLMMVPMDSPFLVSLAGIANGLYIGMFFSGMNFYSLWFSDNKQLSKVISLQYSINGIVQLVIPPMAGWIIHEKGYIIAFFTAVMIIFIQVLCSIVTPQVKIRYPFRRKGFFVPTNKKMAFLGLSSASFGFFYAFVHMSISIFVYVFVKNESTLGEWNMLFGFLTVSTYFILGKTLLQPYRELIGTLGVIFSTVITLTLFVPYPASFIVFNVIVSISLPMMWLPTFTRHFSTIQHQVKLSKANPLTKMMELLVFREFCLCIGRLSFLFILLLNLTIIKNELLSVLIFFLCFMPASLFLLGKKVNMNYG
jgi:YQGE family putative transporter